MSFPSSDFLKFAAPHNLRVILTCGIILTAASACVRETSPLGEEKTFVGLGAEELSRVTKISHETVLNDFLKNGPAYSACTLLRAFRNTTRRERCLFPIKRYLRPHTRKALRRPYNPQTISP